MTPQTRRLLERARETLRPESASGPTPDEALTLAHDLLQQSFFTYAAAVMAVTLERSVPSRPKRTAMIQLQALATYKDTSQPVQDRLDRLCRSDPAEGHRSAGQGRRRRAGQWACRSP